MTMMSKKSFARGQRLQLHIDRLSVGGRGVARASNDTSQLVIFVPDVCADEDVEVELTFIKKNYAEARLISVVRASEKRMTPPCPVAGICGGCNWQHIDYDEQVRTKRDLVRESLRKFSGFDVSQESSVLPVIASPKALRYRNRVQFHHAGSELGYFKRGSHALISINDCPIAEEPIAERIPELRERLKNEPAGRFEVFIAEDESVQTRGGGIGQDDDDDGGLSFAFSQVNTQQNRNLISLVVSAFMTKFIENESPHIFDLYAGSGNFTFPLAKAFPQGTFTAVELNHESVERGIRRAKETFAESDIRPEIHWMESDVGTFLAASGLPPGAGVLIDPPRSGCEPNVVAKLAASPIAFLVYVSCHPVTLARDLRVFHENGWKLESVQPLDMFPQTDHVETLVVLTRSTSV